MACLVSNDPSSGLYQPLPDKDYIRIIELHPGNSSDKISCTLKVVKFQSVIDKYEAISYVWGDSKITIDILCNGLHVLITTSLADALKTFRHATDTRTLWADGLCINQTENEEKSHQVNMMGQVYENAKGVLVWLGPDNEGIAQDCFELIEETNKYFGEEYLRNNRNAENMPILRAPYPICMDRARWVNVGKLYDFPWFERVWVIQEVALAKQCELVWGQSTTSAAIVFELALWREQKSDFGSILYGSNIHLKLGRIGDMFSLQSSYQNAKSWRYESPLLEDRARDYELLAFTHIIDGGRSMKATNPRDHIYGFLGNPLARKQDGDLIVDADYDKSVEEVYFSTARALLKDPKEAPWVLSSVEHWSLHELAQSKEPSWVPRWTDGFLHCGISISNHWAQAGGPNRLFQAQISDEKILEVAGFVFDRIVWTSRMMISQDMSLNPELDNDTTQKPWIDELCEECFNVPGSFPPLVDDEFTLTLVGEYGLNKLGITNMKQHRADFDEYRRCVRSKFTNEPIDNGQVSGYVGNPYFIKDILEYNSNRRLIRTETGGLGLAHGPCTEVGDVCCIFAGVNVPFILKPSQNGRYKLVGESFVYGVMRGELAEPLESEERHWETIHLE